MYIQHHVEMLNVTRKFIKIHVQPTTIKFEQTTGNYNNRAITST